MAEYIEREAFVNMLNRFFCNLAGKKAQVLVSDIKHACLEIPAADVVTVRHGEWLPDYETFVDEWERESEPIQTGWVCSLCGNSENSHSSYCPNCGAKMDGKGEGE